MKKKILFIINPVSGNKRKQVNLENIKSALDLELFDADFIYTKYAGHAYELSLSNLNNYEIITAVGGDGTVNEIAKALENTNTNLAILPLGSGNGLARFLKIPMSLKKAVAIINNEYARKIDTISINNKFCANVSGIGFDAHIGNKFQHTKNRGFLNYIMLVVKEFTAYKPNKYKIKIDGIKYEKNAFLISFANSGQFGNNAYIAPTAVIDDGKMDVVIMRKFPLRKSFLLAIKLFNKTLTDSSYIDTYKAKEVIIENNKDLLAHVDGDPVNFEGNLNLKINNKSLKVICPQ